MTDPILPFEILNIRDDGDGRTVFFKVGKRSMENSVQTSLTMTSAMFFKYDEDINTALLKALTEQGWVV